jgi:predicted PurR-regulated permease PerM
VAGLTVLLPFLGPLVSVVLTIGVCVVTGHADLTLLGLIGATYVTMNMIVEQLFLYPAFVGEALGLNILETLIVVLLGGLFAGLAGMIFAVPVASVLKFLIPRLYQSFFQSDELELPGQGEGVVSSE